MYYYSDMTHPVISEFLFLEGLIMDEEIRTCSMCGCELQENETVEVDGEAVCDECAEQYTTTCDHCGETIWAEDAVTDEHMNLCSCCFDDHYRRCENCGRLVNDNDVLWSNDLPYCAHCYDNLDVEIEEYSYKPEPIFYGEGSRYFGVELEVDCGGKEDDNAGRIKADANTRDEYIYIKADGSLDDGFEIVTHPMTLDFHMKQMYWEDVLKEAVRLGYKSHMTSTCGLHIHVNRDAFGENEAEQEKVIERLLFFVETHWNELFTFSRRSPHNINRWAARYGMEKSGKEILDKAKKGNLGRYAAVNLCPYQTIEFRIFRGTLKLNTLYATLQLVNKICDVALSMSEEEIGNQSWSDFVQTITEPELIQYLKERRLYVNEEVVGEEEQ